MQIFLTNIFTKKGELIIEFSLKNASKKLRRYNKYFEEILGNIFGQINFEDCTFARFSFG